MQFISLFYLGASLLGSQCVLLYKQAAYVSKMTILSYAKPIKPCKTNQKRSSGRIRALVCVRTLFHSVRDALI